MKLKETLSGCGDIFENNIHLKKVNYSLYIYQEIFDSRDGQIEGLLNIQGEIDPNIAF